MELAGMKETLLPFNLLVESVAGRVIATSDENRFSFSSVSIDSRNMQSENGKSLFVALVGNNQDGHSYIEQAIKNGAGIILVNKTNAEKNLQMYSDFAKKYDCAFIAVENTLYALQQMAFAYVKQFPHLKKIGITGSSGKTTTKEILASLLAEKYSVVMNDGNFNSETGLPLSVFKIRSHHEVGVFELGMNRMGELAEIASVLLPDIAVITNIGTAHIGIIGSKDKIANEKKQIFKDFTKYHLGFIPEAEYYTDFLCAGVAGTIKTFGIKSCKMVSHITANGIFGTDFSYKDELISLQLPGKHNFSNALAAIAVAESLNLSAKQIKSGFAKVKPLFGRSQILQGPYTLVQDCYNANPDSMLCAIDFCDEVQWNTRKMYILGDMLELGEKSYELHQKIGQRLRDCTADIIIFYGKEMYAAFCSCGKAKKNWYAATMDELKKIVAENIYNGDFILLKASKGMALWQICQNLGFTVGINEK